MAKRSEIQYIRLYTDGSAARQLEFAPPKQQPRQPAPKKRCRPQEKVQIVIDPVALCGIVVAAVMLVMMVLGVIELSQVCSEAAVMENYVQQLQEKSQRLQTLYHSSYDLDAVRQAALGLGMIPLEEAEVIQLPAGPTQGSEDLTWWENFAAVLQELFA